MEKLLNAVTGLGLVDQMSQNSDYNLWYNPVITAKQSNWIDTVIKNMPDLNYKTLRKRKYLKYG